MSLDGEEFFLAKIFKKRYVYKGFLTEAFPMFLAEDPAIPTKVVPITPNDHWMVLSDELKVFVYESNTIYSYKVLGPQRDGWFRFSGLDKWQEMLTKHPLCRIYPK